MTVIVVGSGPNGLVAANLLADEGSGYGAEPHRDGQVAASQPALSATNSTAPRTTRYQTNRYTLWRST